MKKILLFGTFTNYSASIVVMLCNYGTSVYIARVLGPNQYGIYAIIFAILNLLSLVSINGIQSATSKYVSQMPEQAATVRKSALKLTGTIALVVSGVFFFLAPPLAVLLKDPSLTPYLQIITLVIVPFFIYPVFLGYFNGLKKYHKQAVVQVTFALVGAIFIVGLVYSGLKIYGAIAGFALGSLAACVTGYIMAGRSHPAGYFSMKKLLLFGVPFTVLSFTFVGARSSSLLLIKSLLGDNDLTAHYNIAMRICIFPYNISMAIATSLFPLVAQSFSAKDKIGLISDILKSFKYLAVSAIPASLLIIVFRKTIISFVFGENYLSAAGPIKILSAAEIFIGMQYILLIVLSGIDKHKTAMVISIFVLVIAVVFNLVLIPKYSISGAAVATLISYATGAAISSAAVIHYLLRMKHKSQMCGQDTGIEFKTIN